MVSIRLFIGIPMILMILNAKLQQQSTKIHLCKKRMANTCLSIIPNSEAPNEGCWWKIIRIYDIYIYMYICWVCGLLVRVMHQDSETCLGWVIPTETFNCHCYWEGAMPKIQHCLEYPTSFRESLPHDGPCPRTAVRCWACWRGPAANIAFLSSIFAWLQLATLIFRPYQGKQPEITV